MAFNKDTAKQTKQIPLVYGINIKGFELLPHVNLDNNSKKKLGLRVFNDEPEYVVIKKNKETGEKYKSAIIELYVKFNNPKLVEDEQLKDLNGTIYPIRFYIDNFARPIGKNSGKTEYVNELEETGWLLDENDTESKHFMSDLTNLRVAFNGESKFIDALRKMFNVRTGGFERWDIKKLFNNNFSQIKEDIKGITEAYPNHKFSMLMIVKSTEKENEETGDIKTFYSQQLYTKAFTPNKIKEEIEKWAPKGTFMVDGKINNYLTLFDPFNIDNKNDEINSGDDLPF